jgi:hypothetical protein
MALQTVGMLLFMALVIIALVAISPFFFEHVISERVLFRIAIWTTLISLYGAFCKTGGQMYINGTTKDAQWNSIIVGTAFLLASFIVWVQAMQECAPGGG